MNAIEPTRPEAANRYTEDRIRKKRAQVEARSGCDLSATGDHGLDPTTLAGNVEACVGATRVPVGVAGPVLVHGEHAQGRFFVPMATTEGSLVASYSRGMLAISKSGGVRVRVLSDFMCITPVFTTSGLLETAALRQAITERQDEYAALCAEYSAHTRLQALEFVELGNRLFATFRYATGDAMGQNIVNILTQRISTRIADEFGVSFILRSNLSADKKPSVLNFVSGYGKSLVAEATIPATTFRRMLRAEPHRVAENWTATYLSSISSGMIGSNLHLANGLAAIFIATGQDVAQIVNAAQGLVHCELTAQGDFYLTLRLPCLPVATVGGGTLLPTQREALELMGSHGSGNARKFAEVVTAALLAGELSLASAITEGGFVEAHTRNNDHARSREAVAQSD